MITKTDKIPGNNGQAKAPGSNALIINVDGKVLKLDLGKLLETNGRTRETFSTPNGKFIMTVGPSYGALRLDLTIEPLTESIDKSFRLPAGFLGC